MQKLLYELLYIMGVIFMVNVLLKDTEQYKELVNAGVPEDHIKEMMRGFMADRVHSELDDKVEYLNTLPGCYGAIIELFELFGKYPNYTKQFRAREKQIVDAKEEAIEEKRRANYQHWLKAQENIALNKELRKILKGGH